MPVAVLIDKRRHKNNAAMYYSPFMTVYGVGVFSPGTIVIPTRFGDGHINTILDRTSELEYVLMTILYNLKTRRSTAIASS